MENRSVFQQAARHTLPVLMGYIPLGITFGFVAVQAGHPWWYAVTMSTFVYSGATQFFILGLSATGMSLATAIVMACLLNLRHSFYGLSLLTRFSATRWAKPYLIFAITDETFALLMTIEEPDPCTRTRLYVAISFFDQLYWVAGTLIGALLGTAVPASITGIEFSLTALFVVLAVESTEKIRSLVPLAVALATTVLGHLLLPSSAVLPVSIALGTGMLLFLGRHTVHA
ncbi:MAG: AzlC family ABC transporter permease [Caldiserica bacterium]|nr:AzlC family ABC transporter permease [Caldisericota bacterium]